MSTMQQICVENWLEHKIKRISGQKIQPEPRQLQKALDSFGERDLLYLYYEIARDFGLFLSLEEIESGVFDDANLLIQTLKRAVKGKSV